MIETLIATLASSGLNLLAGAVQSKGKEFVEEKLGVKLTEPKDAEDVKFLKQLEMQHEEFLLDIGVKQAEIALKEKQLEVDNTVSARNMNSAIQTSEHASDIAKTAAYYIDFAIIGATLFLAWFTFFQEIPATNKELVYMALGSLLTMCGTILNFHRGTSIGSKSKDKIIEGMSK